MSFPFPYSTHIRNIDTNDLTKGNEDEIVRSAHTQYLNPDERWDVYCVKAAERPHLLSHEENNEISEQDNPMEKEGHIDMSSEVTPPLVDGCDIPGWRKEGLERKYCPSSDVYASFNVGSENATQLMKRCSQWPISPAYYNDEDVNCTDVMTEDQKLSESNRSVWRNLRGKLSTPPKAENDSICVNYEDCCEDDVDYAHFIKCADNSERILKRTMFSKEFEEKNIPAKILNATQGWKAMPDQSISNKGWTFYDFVERFRNIKWRFSDVHGEMMEMGTYQKYIFAEGSYDDSPLGIYDSEFGDDEATNVLLKEYDVPVCFSQDLFEMCPDEDEESNTSTDSDTSSFSRPPYRWILIGPPRSGTGLHIDPLWTNAWVTLLQGTKRWMLFPPATPPEEVGMIEGKPQIPSSIWFLDYYDKVTSSSWPLEWKPVEVLQKPGETVFVPNGWMHLVLNLDLAVAVTHNYASEFGPFERMWQQVVTDEPEFALPWFNEMSLQRPDLAKRAYDFHVKHADEEWTKNINVFLNPSLEKLLSFNDVTNHIIEDGEEKKTENDKFEQKV